MESEAHVQSRVSRREMLRLATSAAGVALLAACQSTAPAAAPTSVPAAAAKPTLAPGNAQSASTSVPSAATPSATRAAAVAGAGTTDRAAQAGFLPVGASVNSTAPMTSGAGEPRSGGTLRQGSLGSLPNLDGHWISGQDMTYVMFDHLFDLDGSLNAQPALAESWEISPDFTLGTFHLRKGVTWHTGRPLTSEDIAWNFNRIKTDLTVDGGAKANSFTRLAAMETPDPLTLVVHASQPWPAMYTVLSTINMIDSQTPPGGSTPVGTGPFQFVEWVEGDHITMKKNPNYWRTGRPYLDEIQVKTFADPQSMISQLEGGAIDVAVQPFLRDALRLLKDPKYRVVYNQNSGQFNSLLTQAKDGAGPTANKLFRQALNYAIDRQRWVDTVLLGVGTPKSLPVAPTSPAYDSAKDQTYQFDLDKAKALLQQSGVSAPQIEVLFSSASPDYNTVLQIYQSDLAKLGITLTLKPNEQVAYFDQLINSKFPNLAGATGLFGQMQPAFFMGIPYYNPDHNWAGFKTAEYSQIGGAMQTETDPAKQKPLFAQWTDYILDQAWCIPWSGTVPRSVATTKVQGLAYNMSESFKANDAWLSS